MRRALVLLLVSCAPHSSGGSDEDLARDIRLLEDGNAEAREQAAARLLTFGDRAVAALKKCKGDRARTLAARIEWEPYVSPRLLGRNPGVYSQLADEEGAAIQVYGEMAQGCGIESPYLRKALRDGSPALKKVVLSRIGAFRSAPMLIGEMLTTLLGWDGAAHPLSEDDVQGLITLFVASIQPEHVSALRTLAARDSKGLRLLAVLSLAAVGDPGGRTEALAELRQTIPWRAVLAIQAFRRSPCPQAGPLIAEGLRSREYPITLAALDATGVYPEVDVREPLVALLSSKFQEIQAKALHHLAVRRIDESARIWPLVQAGTLKWTRDPEVDGDPSPGSLGVELGAALLVGDDPIYIDRMEWAIEHTPVMADAMRVALLQAAIPQVEARLQAVADGTERASGAMRRIASGYFAAKLVRSVTSTRAAALAFLEKGGAAEAMKAAFELLEGGRTQPFLQLCRQWVGAKDHPLRSRAAAVLHASNVKEGTDALLELAEGDAKEGWRILSQHFQGDGRAKPLLQRKLESADFQWHQTARQMLAQLNDESVVKSILAEARQGDGSGVNLLVLYPDRDFTEDLVKLLNESTPAAMIFDILAYLLSRSREDQVAVMRTYANHKDERVRSLARHALGAWRDRTSVDELLRAYDKERSSELLGVLMQIDPDRVRPRLMKLFEDDDMLVRVDAAYILARNAGPADRDVMMKLIRTEDHAFPLLTALGRIGGHGAGELLFEAINDGDPHCYAAIGLAYLGDPRAVPFLMKGLHERGPKQAFNALDIIVNRSHYPELSKRVKTRAAPVPMIDALKRFREVFGIEIACPGSVEGPGAYFFDDQLDFVEWLEELGSDRFAHIWRDGRIELVSPGEASVYWKAWWARNSGDYR